MISFEQLISMKKNKYSKVMEKEVSQIPIKFNLKASSIFKRKWNQNW